MKPIWYFLHYHRTELRWISSKKLFYKSIDHVVEELQPLISLLTLTNTVELWLSLNATFHHHNCNRNIVILTIELITHVPISVAIQLKRLLKLRHCWIITSPWRRCPTYARNAPLVIYVSATSVDHPVDQQRCSLERLRSGLSCLVWSPQRSCIRFLSYTVSSYNLP